MRLNLQSIIALLWLYNVIIASIAVVSGQEFGQDPLAEEVDRDKRALDLGFFVRNLLLKSSYASNTKAAITRNLANAKTATTTTPRPRRTTTRRRTTAATFAPLFNKKSFWFPFDFSASSGGFQPNNKFNNFQGLGSGGTPNGQVRGNGNGFGGPPNGQVAGAGNGGYGGGNLNFDYDYGDQQQPTTVRSRTRQRTTTTEAPMDYDYDDDTTTAAPTLATPRPRSRRPQQNNQNKQINQATPPRNGGRQAGPNRLRNRPIYQYAQPNDISTNNNGASVEPSADDNANGDGSLGNGNNDTSQNTNDDEGNAALDPGNTGDDYSNDYSSDYNTNGANGNNENFAAGDDYNDSSDNNTNDNANGNNGSLAAGDDYNDSSDNNANGANGNAPDQNNDGSLVTSTLNENGNGSNGNNLNDDTTSYNGQSTASNPGYNGQSTSSNPDFAFNGNNNAPPRFGPQSNFGATLPTNFRNGNGNGRNLIPTRSQANQQFASQYNFDPNALASNSRNVNPLYVGVASDYQNFPFSSFNDYSGGSYPQASSPAGYGYAVRYY